MMTSSSDPEKLDFRPDGIYEACGVNTFRITDSDADFNKMKREDKAGKATNEWYKG